MTLLTLSFSWVVNVKLLPLQQSWTPPDESNYLASRLGLPSQAPVQRLHVAAQGAAGAAPTRLALSTRQIGESMHFST